MSYGPVVLVKRETHGKATNDQDNLGSSKVLRATMTGGSSSDWMIRVAPLRWKFNCYLKDKKSVQTRGKHLPGNANAPRSKWACQFRGTERRVVRVVSKEGRRWNRKDWSRLVHVGPVGHSQEYGYQPEGSRISLPVQLGIYLRCDIAILESQQSSTG